MKRHINKILIYLLFGCMSCSAVKTDKNITIDLFSVPVKVEKVIFEHNKPKGTIFGDGFFARIYKIDKTEFDAYIDKHVKKNNLWKTGPVSKKGHEVIAFIEEWIDTGADSEKKIHDFIDLKSLSKSKEIYYIIKNLQYSSDKKYMTNATIFILDKKSKLIIILCQDT